MQREELSQDTAGCQFNFRLGNGYFISLAYCKNNIENKTFFFFFSHEITAIKSRFLYPHSLFEEFHGQICFVVHLELDWDCRKAAYRHCGYQDHTYLICNFDPCLRTEPKYLLISVIRKFTASQSLCVWFQLHRVRQAIISWNLHDISVAGEKIFFQVKRLCVSHIIPAS